MILKTLRLMGKSWPKLALAASAAMWVGAAQATEVCYDFSNILGASAGPGSTIALSHAVLEVDTLQALDGTHTNNGAEMVSVDSGNILGSPPEAHLYISQLRIIPNTPLSKITMRVAQNTGLDGRALDSNLGINYERLQLANGLASANGLVFGNNNIGQVEVSADWTNPTPPYSAHWLEGSLEFTALNGAIHTLTIGTIQGKIDDVCLTD